MQGDWFSAATGSPSQPAREKTLYHPTKTAAARELGAVAANSKESARSLADNLPSVIRSNNYWKFSSAVIASNANKSMWPKSVTDGEGSCASVVSPSEKLLSETIAAGTLVDSITLPSDTLASFLESTARREAVLKSHEFSAHVKELRLLPPVARSVSFEEVIGAVSKNVPLMKSVESFEMAGTPVAAASSGPESASLATFLKTAKSLRRLSAKQCDAQSIAVQIANAVKDGTIEHASLEGNSLGLASGDAALADETRSAIADMLKSSKFLLSLNLAHNNFSSEAAVSFLEALAASDTKLTPEALAELNLGDGIGQALPEPVPVEELVDRSLFFGEGSQVDEEEDNPDDAFMEEDAAGLDADVEEAAPEEDAGRVDGDAASAGGSDQDEEGEERDEEDAAEDTEEGEAEEADADEEAQASEAADDEEDEEKPFQPDPAEMRRIARALREVQRHEGVARTDIQNVYLKELLPVAETLTSIRACRAEERRKEIAEYCSRRSGWSRLQSLTLRGNAIGDRGVKAVASVLSSTVPRGEEDLARLEEELRTVVTGLMGTLRSARLGTLTEEAAAWRALAKAGRVERQALQRAERLASSAEATTAASAGAESTEEPAEHGEGSEDEDDEYRSEAPPVVMTNMDPEDEGGEGRRHGSEGNPAEDAEDAGDAVDAEGAVEEENFNWEEAATTVSLPILPTKSGMNSIVLLDLGSCNLSGRGLQSIAQVLGDNHSLVTLILRKNGLGASARGKGKKQTTTDVEEVPTGFAAFTAALATNTTLRSLDLGYCELGPSCLRELARGLHGHAGGLHSLNLEGNHFLPRDGDPHSTRGTEAFNTTATAADGLAEACAAGDAATVGQSSALLEILTAAVATGTLRQLNLSHNAIGDSLWTDELNALAVLTTTSLTHLYLNGAGLGGEHVIKWTAACEAVAGAAGVSLEALHLARNCLAGEEGGQCLSTLFARCGALQQLSLDENPHLCSTGLAAALAALPPSGSLRWLSCNTVGAGAASVAVLTADSNGEAAEMFVVPPHLMGGLEYLALGDLDIGEDEVEHLTMWAAQLQEQGHQLRCLSLWSRRLSMEERLQLLEGIVQALPGLHFADFGVLARFDKEADLQDRLGSIERTLVARRVALAQARGTPVA